jgi:hypothetical protein
MPDQTTPPILAQRKWREAHRTWSGGERVTPPVPIGELNALPIERL